MLPDRQDSKAGTGKSHAKGHATAPTSSWPAKPSRLEMDPLGRNRLLPFVDFIALYCLTVRVQRTEPAAGEGPLE